MSAHIKMVVYLSLGLLAVFAWHFGTVLGFFGTAPQTQSEFFWRVGLILVGFFIVSVVTSILVAKNDEHGALPDEREEKIEMKAEQNGVFAIYAGLLVLMWLVFIPMTPMQVANGILAVVCFTEIVKLVSGLYYLNRRV